MEGPQLTPVWRNRRGLLDVGSPLHASQIAEDRRTSVATVRPAAIKTARADLAQAVNAGPEGGRGSAAKADTPGNVGLDTKSVASPRLRPSNSTSI